MTRVTAAAWACVRDGRLLVARTTGSDAFYLPGGKPEPGETLRQTAVREVAEETGVRLDAADLTLFADFVAPAHGRGPGAEVRLVCYTGPGTDAPHPRNEIAELAWFTAADRPRCAPAIRIVIDRLVDAGLLDPPR